MEMNQTFTFTFESRMDQVVKVTSAVKDLCAATSLDKVELYKLELCLTEALNNVIIHAYHNQPGKKIEVNIHLTPEAILFQVLDTGSTPSDFLKHVTLDFNPDDIKSIPENGMGMFIMQEFMDQISYEKKDGKNIISLRKNLKQGSLK